MPILAFETPTNMHTIFAVNNNKQKVIYTVSQKVNPILCTDNSGPRHFGIKTLWNQRYC